MKKMLVTTADGKQFFINVSDGGGLVVFSSEKFAVRNDCCDPNKKSLYISKTGEVVLSISKGERTLRKEKSNPSSSTASAASAVSTSSMQTTTSCEGGTYHIFERANVNLPQSCIESAEHVIKSINRNHHGNEAYANGDKSFCKVHMAIANKFSCDIDNEDDVRDFARKSFGSAKPNEYTAGRENFSAGDGIILLNMQPKGERPARVWALHAVAVLLASTKATDPFIVCSEAFADDDADEISMTDSWHLAYFKNATDFQETYADIMPPDKFSLWALRAVGRS